MGDLQLGLLAAGAIAVVGVFFYNKWQELQYRRKAEASFGSRHEDVLMRGGNGGTGTARTVAAPADRVEPVLRASGIDPDDGAVAEPVLSELLDFVVPIETAEAVPGGAVLAAAAVALAGCTKPVRWEGFDETRRHWEALRPDRNYSMLRAGLQLVDRRGMVSADELDAFGTGIEQAASEALAAVPDIAAAHARAVELDRFCGDVDIQVAVHIVSGAVAFSGVKVRALAEAAGFELNEQGGKFELRDEDGRIFCALGNMEPAPFSAAGLESLSTRGLTLELDVPCAPHDAFQQFRELAQELAQALEARIVDDKQQPLGAAAFDAIGMQLQAVYRTMEARGISPGSALARRLFS